MLRITSTASYNDTYQPLTQGLAGRSSEFQTTEGAPPVSVGASLPSDAPGRAEEEREILPLPGGDKKKDDAQTKATKDYMKMGKQQTGIRKLSEEELRIVTELQQRDREVRTHEQAHMAAAGGYAMGGPSYQTTTGPDGRQYAIGGNVKLDVSEENTPESTIAKAQVIKRAALAPANPSGADRSVAASATKMEMKARSQVLAAKTDGKTQKGHFQKGNTSTSMVPNQEQSTATGALINSLA